MVTCSLCAVGALCNIHYPSKTDLDFPAIVLRDAKTAATWFTGPASGPADAYRDRRALIEAYAALRASIETTAPLPQPMQPDHPLLTPLPAEEARVLRGETFGKEAWRVALPKITEQHAADFVGYRSLMEFKGSRWEWTQDAVDFACMLQGVRQDAMQPVEPSPLHPGPSIEKAFASSPRRIDAPLWAGDGPGRPCSSPEKATAPQTTQARFCDYKGELVERDGKMVCPQCGNS